MSLLSYTEIHDLIKRGIITGADPENVNSASLDIRIGPVICKESVGGSIISLKQRDSLPVTTRNLPYILAPGEFVLASSHEIFNLPDNISAEYKLKSSMARIGLEHLNAGWCDAGWHGSALTLELKNMNQYHPIIISSMDKIGQIVFFRHLSVPHDKSYSVRGRYNNDSSVQGVKP